MLPILSGVIVLSPILVYSGSLYSLMLSWTPPGQSGLSISNQPAFSLPKSTRRVPVPLTTIFGAGVISEFTFANEDVGSAVTDSGLRR